MNGLKLGATALAFAGLMGCETMSTGQLMQAGLEAAIQNYAGRTVSAQQPRDAYRPVNDYRREDSRYVRETTGYQRFGPYTNSRGQRYVTVREYFSDGSYEDSPQLY